MADLTHIDGAGKAQMVDVGGKTATSRRARASGYIRMAPGTLDAIQRNQLQKGDVLAVARIAGIMAAKRTAEPVPLCHPLALDDVQVRIEPDPALPGLRVEAEASTVGRTGVEMEAMVGVMVTLVTVYDMAKAHDRGMVISDVRLEEKSGGKSGLWKRG